MDYDRLDCQDRIDRAYSVMVDAMAAAARLRDPYTAEHQRRVAELVVYICKKLQIPDEEIEGIRLAAALHDIGKMGIPIEYLMKPTMLTNLEYSVIQTHARAGADILTPAAFPWPVADYVYQHHERYDGSGYPRGLRHGEIHLASHIIAVADIIEAMTADRPYRFALGLKAALDFVRSQSGIGLHPEVVPVTLELFDSGEFTFSETSWLRKPTEYTR